MRVFTRHKGSDERVYQVASWEIKDQVFRMTHTKSQDISAFTASVLFL